MFFVVQLLGGEKLLEKCRWKHFERPERGLTFFKHVSDRFSDLLSCSSNHFSHRFKSVSGAISFWWRHDPCTPNYYESNSRKCFCAMFDLDYVFIWLFMEIFHSECYCVKFVFIILLNACCVRFSAERGPENYVLWKIIPKIMFRNLLLQIFAIVSKKSFCVRRQFPKTFWACDPGACNPKMLMFHEPCCPAQLRAEEVIPIHEIVNNAGVTCV